MDRCEEGLEIARLFRIDGQTQRLDQGFSIAGLNRIPPGFGVSTFPM